MSDAGLKERGHLWVPPCTLLEAEEAIAVLTEDISFIQAQLSEAETEWCVRTGRTGVDYAAWRRRALVAKVYKESHLREAKRIRFVLSGGAVDEGGGLDRGTAMELLVRSRRVVKAFHLAGAATGNERLDSRLVSLAGLLGRIDAVGTAAFLVLPGVATAGPGDAAAASAGAGAGGHAGGGTVVVAGPMSFADENDVVAAEDAEITRSRSLGRWARLRASVSRRVTPRPRRPLSTGGAAPPPALSGTACVGGANGYSPSLRPGESREVGPTSPSREGPGSTAPEAAASSPPRPSTGAAGDLDPGPARAGGGDASGA